jgi:hypothetical protein
MEPASGRKSARTAAASETVPNYESVIDGGGGMGKSDLVENSAEGIVSGQPSTALRYWAAFTFPRDVCP